MIRTFAFVVFMTKAYVEAACPNLALRSSCKSCPLVGQFGWTVTAGVYSSVVAELISFTQLYFNLDRFPFFQPNLPPLKLIMLETHSGKVKWWSLIITKLRPQLVVTTARNCQNVSTGSLWNGKKNLPNALPHSWIWKSIMIAWQTWEWGQ